MQATSTAYGSVFVGSRATVRYHIFTDRPSKKIERKLAVALKDRIYEDFLARKAETDIGKLTLYRIYVT